MTKPTSEPILLAEVPAGQRVCLARVSGGHRMQHRLAEMGLRVGGFFEVASNSRRGPCTIRLQGSKLIIGRGMIDRLWVTLAGDEAEA